MTAWPDTDKRVAEAIGELVDAAPGPVGSVVESGPVTAIAPAPGRYLLVLETDELAGTLRTALPASDAAVCDLSHGQTVLRLAGEAAADILSKGLAIDLHPSVFAPGRAALSAIHHMDVLVIKRQETVFDLLVSRSFALSLAEWLLDAGSQYGIGLSSP